MYSPVAITGFYGGMTLLEGKSVDEAVKEIKNKYWPTFRVRNYFLEVTIAKTILCAI